MKVSIKTESGSFYILDKDEMTWSRPVAGEGSVFVRTKMGDLAVWPKYEVGKRMFMLGTPLTEGALCRYIETTPIVSIEETA